MSSACSDARREADAHSGTAFAGIPTLIKDMVDVAGLPTRFGSAAFPNAAPAPGTNHASSRCRTSG